MAHQLTAEAIIFAINSAIKLGRNVQKAYAESLKSREILLPLPRFSGEPPLRTIEDFFNNQDKIEGGARFLEKIEHLQILHTTYRDSGLEGEDRKDYVSYYLQFYDLLQQDHQAIRLNNEGGPIQIDDSKLNVDDLLSLLRIRQYEHPKMVKTSALQIVAGTMVEIGIDYFNQVPGALNTNSSFGKAMKSFLAALDDIPFSDGEAFKEMSNLILPKLFITAAEVIGEFSAEISSDEKLQQFIQATSKGLANDLFVKVRKIKEDASLSTLQKDDESEKAIRWGQLILRSMVKNAGTYVFNSPAELFDTNDGGSQLIKSTGGALLEIILSDPDNIDIRKAFNIESLDRMVKVALNVVAEHPSLVVGPNGERREGFHQIVIGISQAISKSGIRRPDLLPELIRLVLEHTAGNLEMLWISKPGGGEHLLVIAVKHLMEVISEPIPNASWRPTLSKAQLIAIAENILDEVVENPGWVRKRENKPSLLKAVLRAVFQALAPIPKHERFSGEVVTLLIRISMRTVTNSQQVLKSIPWENEENKVVVLNKALDLVFAYIFDQKKVKPTERIGLLIDLAEYITEVIIARHPNKKGLLLVDLILFKAPGVDYTGGFNRKLADQLINASLSVLNEHPNLVSSQVSLQNIISGVAEILDASSFREAGILPELLRLVLENTGRNIRLIIKPKSDSPQYMLVVALEQLMYHLSSKKGADHWQPQLTSAEALSIVELMLDEIVLHPEWVIPEGDSTLYNEVLTSIFAALATIPKRERLDADTLAVILQTCMRTAATSQKILDALQWADDTAEVTILNRALDLVFEYVFRQSATTGEVQINLLVELLEYIMEVILAYHPDERGLILIDLILFKHPDVDYTEGFDDELADQLITATLEVMEAHPELVTRHKAMQILVRDVAAALDASSFDNPYLLPELVRLVLESTAENIHLVLETTSGTPRFLLIDAVKKLLAILSHPGTTTDPWLPRLTPAQVLEIAADSADELVNHPEWLIEREDGLSLYETVVDSVFLTLAKAPKSDRFTPEVLHWILRNALHAVARHESLLSKVKWGTGEEEVFIIQQALDIALSYIFEREDQTNRMALMEVLLDYIFETILRQHPDKRCLLLIHLILFEHCAFTPSGSFDEERADQLIDAALAVISQYPELVSRDRIFQKVLKDTAIALRNAKVDAPNLLPELIRLTLENLANNLDALMNMRVSGPRNLLALAIEQVLRAIAEKPASGKWKPSLTENQMLEIVLLVMAEVVANPKWVNDNLIYVVIKAIYAGLEAIPKTHKIAYPTLLVLVESALQAVAFRKQLVIKFIDRDGEEQVLALTYSLEALFVTIYDKNGDTEGSWTLSQTPALNAIIELYLLKLSEQGASKESIEKATDKVEDAIKKINDDLAFTLHDLLGALQEV